ncbi:MAG: hypothetical protein JRH11_08250 [Deltaproteobacteria bacterium]|nr:hypothetical protein [Deltaproteobacteria bacterium]
MKSTHQITVPESAQHRGAGPRGVARLFAVFVLLAFSGLVAACSDDPVPPPPMDSGVRDSTTIVDGGDPDTTVPMDAGADASPPDAAPATCAGDCTPTDAATCGDAGVCTLSAALPMCLPEVGTKVAGATCESTLDCLPGLACFARGAEAICAQVCCPSDAVEACPSPETCTGSGVLVDDSITGWWSCVGVRSCDVLDPAEVCEADEGCYIVSPDADTNCLRAGPQEVGQPCARQNDCSSGLFCSAGGECLRICAIGTTSGDGACPAAEGGCQAYPHSPDGSGICTAEP